ncbi:hypothetical protein V5N11_025595 [Cardamine amara subsp. amara]|uniref:GAG-pre-integrase domain-containing protein n=1 Tax=Cardamine amara subsp. amara TaxID=228776 RepID=A0ABD1C933_CARAN
MELLLVLLSAGLSLLASPRTLPNVLYVPDFNCTLISVAKLLKHIWCIAIFTEALCFLHDHFTRTLIGAGEEHEGVYYFTGVLAAHVNKVTKELTSASLWHRRLGHPSTGVLLSLSEFDHSHSDLEMIKSCDTCFELNKLVFFFLKALIKLQLVLNLFIAMFGVLIAHQAHVAPSIFLLW